MTKTSMILRSVVLLSMLGLLALPIGAAQSQQDFWSMSERKFYLHLAQYCDRPVSLIRWMDEFDWKNDLHGCGGNVLDPASSWTDVFPAFTPFYGNLSGTSAAEMHIFILSRAVDQTSVEASLDFGYAKCEGSAGPELLVQEKVGGFHEFVIPCTFTVSGPAVPTAEANLTITVTATHSYGYGTEGDAASYVTITGVEPAPPAKKVEFFAEGERPLVQFEESEVVLAELPPTVDAKGKSPGLDTGVTFVALAGLILGFGRMRRRS